MDKFTMLVIAAIFSTGVMAQENVMHKKAMQETKKMQMKDHVKMKEGKMMMVKEGKMIMMDKEMTMGNGTVVYPNGMLRMKDGKTMMMKNGDKMNLNGMMMKDKMKERRDEMKMNKMEIE